MRSVLEHALRTGGATVCLDERVEPIEAGKTRYQMRVAFVLSVWRFCRIRHGEDNDHARDEQRSTNREKEHIHEIRRS